jgi:hypothetical protein
MSKASCCWLGFFATATAVANVQYGDRRGRYNCYGARTNHGTERCITVSGLSIDVIAIAKEVLRVQKPLGMEAAVKAIEAQSSETTAGERQLEIALHCRARRQILGPRAPSTSGRKVRTHQRLLKPIPVDSQRSRATLVKPIEQHADGGEVLSDGFGTVTCHPGMPSRRFGAGIAAKLGAFSLSRRAPLASPSIGGAEPCGYGKGGLSSALIRCLRRITPMIVRAPDHNSPSAAKITIATPDVLSFQIMWWFPQGASLFPWSAARRVAAVLVQVADLERCNLSTPQPDLQANREQRAVAQAGDRILGRGGRIRQMIRCSKSVIRVGRWDGSAAQTPRPGRTWVGRLR